MRELARPLAGPAELDADGRKVDAVDPLGGQRARGGGEGAQEVGARLVGREPGVEAVSAEVVVNRPAERASFARRRP